jgi:predicted membrane protein
VLVWAVNIGLTGFLVGLMIDSSILKQIFAPILGIALLAAIFTALPALSRSRATA